MKSIFGTASAILSMIPVLAFGQTFRLVEPASPYTEVGLYSVSHDGRTTAGATSGSTHFVGMVDRPEARTTFDGPSDGLHSNVLGLSATGDYSAGWSLQANTPTEQAFRRDSAGNYVNIPRLRTNHTFNWALGISASGSRVVGYSGRGQDAAERNEAFLWDETTGLQSLGFLSPNGVMSRANAISADGLTVVGFSVSEFLGNNSEGFVWTAASGMTRLFYPNGAAATGFVDVSASGRFVIGGGYRWDSGVPLSIGLLPGQSQQTMKAMSDDGRVIVGTAGNAVSERAYIWTESEGIQFLQDYLLGIGTQVPTGWRLSEATAISGDGSTITGSVYDLAGVRHAFVATIPAPGSVVVVGLAALPRRRRMGRRD